MSDSTARLPPGIAYVRLAMTAADERAFAISIDNLPLDSPIRALAATHPEGWRTVHDVLGAVSHDDPIADAGRQMSRVAAMFDSAVAISPEASVAIYSLGDADALEAATAEIVDWLAGRGLLGGDRRVLDIGCGIGRLERAIADRIACITGIDVSEAMIAEARRRCAELPKVTIERTSGLDLATFRDHSFDIVIALDSFPYVVAAGEDLTARMVREAARVLAPSGSLVICNYAYQGTPEAHRAALERLGRTADLTLTIAGDQPFQHWDGQVYQLRKAS